MSAFEAVARAGQTRETEKEDPRGQEKALGEEEVEILEARRRIGPDGRDVQRGDDEGAAVRNRRSSRYFFPTNLSTYSRGLRIVTPRKTRNG